MAKIVENKKGFKVIQASMLEMCEVYGAMPICDSCGKDAETGFLISVLNQWFCPACYGRWQTMCINYTDDKPHEQRKFEEHKKLFGV